MERSREESQVYPNGVNEEVQLPPLNLRITETPEFLSFMEPIIIQHFPYLRETPKKTEKAKAVNFPISKITIGQWTHTAVYPVDLTAKFYIRKKILMWEILDNVETETGVVKMKRKIEMRWTDVLSLKPSFHSHDESGILEVELSKRPTFFIETNPRSRTHTQWKQTDQDFTQDQFASKCRRHTLHFAPGVLQKNMEKLLSSHSFWSELIKVNFPSLEDPYFENGFGHVGVGEVNSNMANQYNFNDGGLENNIGNQLHGTQGISQPINEDYDNGRYISESQFNNPMIQDNSQLLGSQVYPQALLETQTNSMQMNEDFSVYPEIGPYLQSVLAEGVEMQNMEHTHLDGNFESNMTSFDQLGDYDYYDQYFSNNNC